MLYTFIFSALAATTVLAVPQFTEISTAPLVGIASGTNSTDIGNYYN
jgi:hypothetical protein